MPFIQPFRFLSEVEYCAGTNLAGFDAALLAKDFFVKTSPVDLLIAGDDFSRKAAAPMAPSAFNVVRREMFSFVFNSDTSYDGYKK